MPATFGSPAPTAALAITNLTKTFVGGRALNGVSFAIEAGEVHALLGENGSGKSTLIKVLSGYHKPDPGAEVLVNSAHLTFGVPHSSYEVGARFVHQDLGLIEDCSISDNLAFGPGFPTRVGTIREKTTRKRARLALEAMSLDLDPAMPIWRLSPAQKTGVAVARALIEDESAPVHLLVLDEPTARLPEHEVELLLAIVRRVRARGIGVLYVTHRLDEVFEIAQRATVLRDGVKVATEQVAGLTREKLLQQLLGAALEQAQRKSESDDRKGAPVLTVQGLASEALRDVNLDVHEHEIVGVAGITGSGRDALCATVFGARPHDAGTIQVNDQAITSRRPDLSMAAGVAYIPAERKLQGCFMDLTARENIGFTSLSTIWRFPTLRKGLEVLLAKQWFSKLGVRPSGGTEQPMATFSGGNQQKIIYGKWFQRQPSLYLLDEPTQGVDVGAKAELHQALFSAAEAGAAVLVSSSDVDELATICDRILVMRNGRIADVLVGERVSVHGITRAALDA